MVTPDQREGVVTCSQMLQEWSFEEMAFVLSPKEWECMNCMEREVGQGACCTWEAACAQGLGKE